MFTHDSVAYWYFRLNGFFQFENFVVHPEKKRDGQRTEADILGVRFPFRAERLIDEPRNVMKDDAEKLGLSQNKIEVVIAEVKRNEPCKLNGPWTDKSRKNIQRVLAAMGCLHHDRLEMAAEDLYTVGVHESDPLLRVRLIAIGREVSREPNTMLPQVTQLVWNDILAFIWRRFKQHKGQKRDVNQWNEPGKRIKRLADDSTDEDTFVLEAMKCMGVNPP